MLPSYLDLFSIEIFGAAEHVALWAPFASQLVHLNHTAERDQSDEGIRGQEAEGHLERFLEGLQILIVHTGVDD